jgi:hypothetical protein
LPLAAIIGVGGALLDHSEHDGTIRSNVDIRDLLRLVNTIASTSQQVPGDA